MRFLKRLAYWAGMLFVLTGIIFTARNFLEQYPEFGLKECQWMNDWLGLTAKPWSAGVLAACAFCAFGSYLVLAMENSRLRRKLHAKKAEPEE